MYSYKAISHEVKRQRSFWSWLAVAEKASKCNKTLGRVKFCSSILWKWRLPLTLCLFCFCADTLLLISSWQRHQRWEGQGCSGSCCVGWQQRWTCRQPASQTSSWPGGHRAGSLSTLSLIEREKKKLLMCLSRLPSIVQMRCCPLQLNAVHKYSNPIERQWQRLKRRPSERTRKRERERENERQQSHFRL